MMYRFSPVRAGQRLDQNEAPLRIVLQTRDFLGGAPEMPVLRAQESFDAQKFQSRLAKCFGRIILRASMVMIDSKYGRIQ